MVKEIIHDTFFLQQKSIEATVDDLYIVNDLLDTIINHKDRCVGMAANMIGYLKTILVFLDTDNNYKIMINPRIIKQEALYKTKEGCLSLVGERECERYNKIKVEYYDLDFKIKIKTFTSFTAEIIQHEMDHFKGIII
jgi:peptide deformylase